MSGRGENLRCKVYVGDLPKDDVTEKDIEREFEYYGKLVSVWVARNPSGFAFVEFEDSRDAEDAVRALDGKSMLGSKSVRVEMSTGRRRTKPWERGNDRWGGPPPRYDRRPAGRPFDPNDECYKCGERGHYAYDCKGSSRPRGGRSRSRSRDRYRRSRSRSRGYNRRSRSRSDSRDRSYRRRSRS